MLISLLPPRLHGWLDELATLGYLAAALFLGFGGPALALLLVAAAVHLVNTRLTDYPQGSLGLYPLPVHARIELCEGAAMLAGAISLGGLTAGQVAALYLFGFTQIGAALLADLRWPLPSPPLPAVRR